MTATLRSLLHERRVNPTHWRLMREGFSVEQIQRMEFVKFLYERGEYTS